MYVMVTLSFRAASRGPMVGVLCRIFNPSQLLVVLVHAVVLESI